MLKKQIRRETGNRKPYLPGLSEGNHRVKKVNKERNIILYLSSKIARGRLTLHLLENGPFHVDVGFLLEVDGAGALEQRARGRHAVLLHVGHVL